MYRPDASPHPIRGEIYAIDTEGLAALDMLEGHPHLYRRSKHWTDLQKKRVWVYRLVSERFKPNNTDRRVGGIWKGSPEENKFWLQQKSA